MESARLKNLRRHPRAEVRGLMTLFSGNHRSTSEFFQISEGGCLTTTRLPLQVGDRVTLHLEVDNHSVRARADVIYALNRQEDGRTAYGFRFEKLYPEYRDVINEIVLGLEVIL